MTIEEFKQCLEVIGRGCEWYMAHPEHFKTNEEGFIEIIGEVPEDAIHYVRYTNAGIKRKKEKDAAKKALGIKDRINRDETDVPYIEKAWIIK